MITEKLIQGKNITIYIVEGPLLPHELIESVYKWDMDNPPLNVMWDLRFADATSITMHHLKRINAEVKKYAQNRHGGKIAILARRDTEYQIARMYELISSVENVPGEYFTTESEEEAMSWLDKK